LSRVTETFAGAFSFARGGSGDMDDDDKIWTIATYCLKMGFKKTTFYKLRKMGLTPAEFRFPGMPKTYFLPKAVRENIDMLEQLQIERADEIEAARRRRIEQARMASAKAVASPRHISKWPKNKGRPRGRPRKTPVTP
jgi:hypothetical protein